MPRSSMRSVIPYGRHRFERRRVIRSGAQIDRERRLLLDQQHRNAGVRQPERRHQTDRTAAGDDDPLPGGVHPATAADAWLSSAYTPAARTSTCIDPMYCISQSITSPGPTGPTPSGVPVMMMSPG